MARTTRLDIVSTEGEIYSGLVEMVVANGYLGEIGITAGHAPLLTYLKPGVIRFTLPGGVEEVYYAQGGILEVQPHAVSVLADVASRADHLDEAAAVAAKARAEEAIANKGEDMDYSIATAELARAIAQLRAIKKIRKIIK